MSKRWGENTRFSLCLCIRLTFRRLSFEWPVSGSRFRISCCDTCLFLWRKMPFRASKHVRSQCETCPIAPRYMAFRKGEALFRVFHSLKMAISCSISPENPAQLFNQKPLQVSNFPNVCQPLESRMLVSNFILLKCGEISICLPEPYIFIQNNSCFTLHFVIILITLNTKGGLEPAFISSHLT